MGNQVKAIQNVATNLQKAEEVGMGEEFWARLRSDASFAERMGNHARTGGFDSARQGDQPYFGTSMKVFGWGEWVAFTKAQPDHKKAEVARSTFPRHTDDLSNPEDHYTFFSRSSMDFPVAGHSRDLALTIDALYLLSVEFVNWPNKPKIFFEDEIPANDLDWIAPPEDTWVTICPPVLCKQRDIPEGYEPASATEYLLGLILYYQKYGNLDLFNNGEIGPIVTASIWKKFNCYYRVGLYLDEHGIWIQSATSAVAIRETIPNQRFLWALKRIPPVN